MERTAKRSNPLTPELRFRMSCVVMVVAAAAVALGEAEAGLACVLNPCNNGVCVDHLNSSSSTFHCFCEDGFTGLLCQTNWDDCWSAPCLNGATCTDLVAGLACTCPPGYTGEFCESEINECRSNPCQNNGTCRDMLDHYVCSCPTGYSGENCEIDVSVCNASSLWAGDSPKCLHGGVCVDGPGLSYTCLCQPGWTGKKCEEDEDECDEIPCQNAALCVNTPGAFACACQFGFTGPLCEENLVFCEANPCKNGAICVMEEHNATCYCVPDYHGPQCEKQYNDCLPYAPRCMNGGECIDGVDSFKCSCPDLTSGALCQCISTSGRQLCQSLPHWFEDKPYEPNVPYDRDFFGTHFNISYQQNDSVVTAEVDVYMTSVSGTAEFPSALVTSDYLISSFVASTFSLDPMDVFTPSSVISAKLSVVFSELPSITVPYFSSEFYGSLLPSSSIDASLTEQSIIMQPTPVLPIMTSSPAPDESFTFSEYPTETTVLLPTPDTTLEGSILTPSADSISLSLLFVSDVLEIPFTPTIATATLTPADQTSSTTVIDGLVVSSTISPFTILDIFTTLIEFTPTAVFPLDTASTPTPLEISATPTFPSEIYTSLTVPEIPITPLPPIDTETPSTPPSETDITSTFYSDKTPPTTEADIPQTSPEIPTTYIEIETTPTPPTEPEITSTSPPKLDTTSIHPETSLILTLPVIGTSPIPEVTIPTSPEVDATLTSLETTSTPMIETTFSLESKTTQTSQTVTLVSPTEDFTTTTRIEIPTTSSFSSNVSTTLSSPPQPYSTPQPHDAVTTFPPTKISSVVCGKSYCLNGGICHVSNGSSRCECAFNYRGASCQLYFYINNPYFLGASYLGLDVGNMSLRTGVQVYVQFTSQEENGLVAYSEGPGEAFFMLLLRNNLLQFVFSCGLNTVSFLQGNEKLTRNCLTDVSVKMWWTPYLHDTPWGPGKCSASLQVNGTDPVYSEQKAWSPLVQLGVLYLGGLPSSYSSPLVVKAGFLPRLKGCVSILEVNGHEVDMWLAGVSGERVQECGTAPCPPQSCYNGGSCVPGPALWSCQCPKGYQGELCEHAECEGVSGPCHSGRCVPTAHHHLCLCPNHRHGLYCELESGVQLPSYSGSVAGYSSYSSYRIDFDITHTLAIRLHFSTATLQQVGLMAYIGNSVRASIQDFLTLSLVRGHLMLTWDLGAGPRRIVTREPLDHKLHTHTALVGRQGGVAWFVVDAQKNISAKVPGFLSSLNTNNLLYIGGHPSWNMSHLPADMWRHSGFHGCVFDLRLAQSPEGPWMAVRVATAFNVQECGRDTCQSSQNPCHNGGSCITFGATYRCECTLGWKGPRCEVPSHFCEGGEKLCHPGSSCVAVMSHQRKTPTCLCQLGRAGTLCDQAMNITDLHFSGEGSYAGLQSTRSLRRESHITMSFKPASSSGILFLALPVRNSGDFMALVLINGTLQFTFNLGLHAPGLVLLHSKALAKLGEWQNVTISRVEGSGSMTFKGHTTQSVSPAPTHAAALLDTHTEVFIGGVPDYSVIPAAVAPREGLVAYQGCIRQVILNGIEHDLRVPDGGLLRGAGLGDCDGTPCGHQVCLHGGTCTPAGDTFVCTCTQDYLGRRCQLPRACLNHQCINGATCILIDEPLGRQKRRQKPPVGSTTSRSAYSVYGRRDDDWLEEVVESYIKGEEESYITKERRNESANGERNIIEDVFVIRNGDLSRYREERTKGWNMRKIEKDSSKKKLLKKREVKANNDEDYRCLCPPGYHGIYCQAAGGWGGESLGAKFSGYSFGIVGRGGHHGTPSPHLDSFALNFTTSASHGLLLWHGQVEEPGQDYLGVGVTGGRMKVVWHLGGGSLGLLLMKEAVSDGQWHSLVVLRHGTVVTAFLDGRPKKASSSGTYTQLNDPYGLLYIGGFHHEVSIKYGSDGHFQRPFVGCMRDLTVHQSSYPIRFSSLTQGQDLQPCS
ncbi:Protein eyes shut [Chionoecetes opilio]|uniref:Protein eyes shut n=1 Tax=Chionoecetes opilio TaxID=41210 RepID=A0A8J4YIT6_CHIOP|nr:Protein eyes shut [Chionoecetes opilio]